MSNAKAVALDADAKHAGALTNKFTAWTGNAPTLKVESSGSKANSLGTHPSSLT